MSYTGIIHRQETDTGVTLRAKAVTPNKMKAAVRDYKITVRKTPESAYQKALDMQSLIKNGIDSLIGDAERDDYSDVDFSQFVDENTVITVINTSPADNESGTHLSDCINDKGVLIDFPKINESDAKGQVKYTTTTIGDDGKTATISFVRDVVIKARDYHDLLNKFTAKFAWNKIYRNKSNSLEGLYDRVDNTTNIFISDDINVPGTADNVNGGYLESFQRTSEIPSPDPEEYANSALLFPELGVGSVFIRTEIVDTLKNNTGTSLFGSSDRLSAGGALSVSPSFDTVYDYVTAGNPNADTRALIVDTLSTPGIQVQAHYVLKGLRIKSTLYMGKQVNGEYVPDTGRKKEVYINLETSSGYLTSSQVANKIYDDANFVLEFRQTSYDGSAMQSITTNGAFNNVTTQSIYFNNEDAYARFPYSQDAGVVGINNKIYEQFYNGDGIDVKFQVTKISANKIESQALVTLPAQETTALFGETADATDLFAILDQSAVEGSLASSWRGCRFIGANAPDGSTIVFAIDITIAAYADSTKSTEPTYTNGTAQQKRYVKITTYPGTNPGA